MSKEISFEQGLKNFDDAIAKLNETGKQLTEDVLRQEKLANDLETAQDIIHEQKQWENDGMTENELRDLQIDGANEARTGEVGKCIS
ncbi:hypothetical protein M0R04_12060 [Candidatus Dojkabacteria bacterium]|nr:hypothetical protein [Candidatus Dojkabacteria bacterium]